MMKLTRTAEEIHVSGYETVNQGETLEVDDRTGDLLLAQGGWTKAKATTKTAAVKGDE